MNFQDTLTELYHYTQEIGIYAAQATNWINGKSVPCIGIRSYFAGYANHDPVVEDVSFMVCGEVYFSNGKEVTDIRDLNDVWTQNPDYYIRLRAVSNTYPTATVDLGKYEIISKTCLDENGTVSIHVARMQ